MREGDDKARNCDGTSEPSYEYRSKTGASFDRCPKAWLANEGEAATWVDDALWFARWRQSPDEGGMLDQDPYWLRVVRLVDAELRAAKAAL
jgi:hypothetical protein